MTINELREKVGELQHELDQRCLEVSEMKWQDEVYDQNNKLQQRIATLESRVGVELLEKILDAGFAKCICSAHQYSCKDLATAISTMVLGEGE